MLNPSSCKNSPNLVQPLNSELEKRSAEYWRSRAEEVRTATERMFDPTSRKIMERVIVCYDELTEWAERQQR